MVEPYILFGGLMFWAVSILAFLFTVGFFAFNRQGKGLLTIIGYLAIVVLFTNADPLGWVQRNWMNVLYGLGIYLAVGSVYMIVRWRVFFIPQVGDIYDSIRTSFMESKNITEVTTTVHKDELRRQVESDYRLNKIKATVPLRVRDNKSRLTSWLTFWPFSLAEFIFGDLLVQLVNRTVALFSGIMQKMADRRFSGYSELN